jgi:hypothetical protein
VEISNGTCGNDGVGLNGGEEGKNILSDRSSYRGCDT